MYCIYNPSNVNVLGLDLIMPVHLFAVECVLQSSELTPLWVTLPFSLSPVATSKDGIRKITSFYEQHFQVYKVNVEACLNFK